MHTRQEKTTPRTPDTTAERPSDVDTSAETLTPQHVEQSNEREAEQNETTKEQAQAEALKNAVSTQDEVTSNEYDSSPASRRSTISNHDLTTNYNRTMSHVQSELTPTSRAFSKVIHHKVVEQTSEVLGASVARPNAILAGAIAAFAVTLGMYLIAKNFGYQLSGFETMGGFILGWVIGLLFDYCKIMITGKRS